MAVTALVAITVAVGAAALLYMFAHDTTGTVVNALILIRRAFFLGFSILLAIGLLSTGATSLIILGAFMVFLGILYFAYDPTYEPLRDGL